MEQEKFWANYIFLSQQVNTFDNSTCAICTYLLGWSDRELGSGGGGGLNRK